MIRLNTIQLELDYKRESIFYSDMASNNVTSYLIKQSSGSWFWKKGLKFRGKRRSHNFPRTKLSYMLWFFQCLYDFRLNLIKSLGIYGIYSLCLETHFPGREREWWQIFFLRESLLVVQSTLKTLDKMQIESESLSLSVDTYLKCLYLPILHWWIYAMKRH